MEAGQAVEEIATPQEVEITEADGEEAGRKMLTQWPTDNNNHNFKTIPTGRNKFFTQKYLACHFFCNIEQGRLFGVIFLFFLRNDNTR